MIILVTGCAGFIGTNLSLKLLQDGHTVYGLDNMISGYEKNVELLKKHHNFFFFKSSIENSSGLKDINSITNFDAIINLACIASPKKYENHPIEVLQANSVGIENLCKLAIKNNCRLIHASSSEIYGDPTVKKQNENYNGNLSTFNDRAYYSEGKRFAETVINTYKKFKKMNAIVFRLFNVYGPYMYKDDGRVIPTFIYQALNNKNITIEGGEQTRSFCYIDDVVDAFEKALNIENRISFPLNIGRDEEIKIVDLATIIREKTNSKSKFEKKNLIHGAPFTRRPDTSLAELVLNWQSKISLDEGLNKLIREEDE